MTSTSEATPPAEDAAHRSARIRRTIYIVTAFGSILVAYIGTKQPDVIGPPEIAAWGSIVALVNSLAAFNVQAGPPR